MKKGNHTLENEKSVFQHLATDINHNRWLYIMMIPVTAYFIIFHYVPMYGAIIAFKDFSPARGILGSKWVEPFYLHFRDFFASPYAWRVIRNTLRINLTALAFGFPAPIIFALLLNEIRNNTFKRLVQTVSYMPYFISMMVICSMILNFFSSNGIVTLLLSYFGLPKENLMIKPQYFVPVYVSTNIWQNMGWNSIIYLAALTNINEELYEAAYIDGAGRWRQVWHVTIPGIAPTIIIMLILRIGGLLSLGFEKIILLYNPSTYETADVISSFVYRMGLQMGDFSYGTAVGLFNSVVNFTLLITANYLARKYSEASLW